jgi:hypothetical protein
MLSGQASRSASAPLPDFLPVWISASNALLYHAPIRIKVFDFHRTRENERRIEVPKGLRFLFSARFHESPLSATADPENDRFQAVSKGKRQLSWLRVPAFQWLTAWSVKVQPSDQKAGWNESPINWDGFASIWPGFPFQPMT